MQKFRPQLSIRVTNKLLQDIQSYKQVFGGCIYFYSRQNGYYNWSVKSREDLLIVLDYFQASKCRSPKSHRFFLIKKYYYLRALNSFKEDSIHYKAWLAFMVKWNKLKI